MKILFMTNKDGYMPWNSNIGKGEREREIQKKTIQNVRMCECVCERKRDN